MEKQIFHYRKSEDGKILGALDLGTSNCRLLISKTEKNKLVELERFSRIVRLGEGLGLRGNLTDIAMQRTISVLKICADKFSRYNLDGQRCVATEACRRAENREELVRRAKDEAGINLEIISTEEEAELAFTSCLNLVDPDAQNVLLTDIGGGSTEIIWAELQEGKPIIKKSFSAKIGVMSLSDLLDNQFFRYGTYQEIVAYTTKVFSPIKESLYEETSKSKKTQYICTSGTITALAALHLDLQRYNRSLIDGISISRQEIEQVKRKLLHMNQAERENLPCVGRERGDLMIPGCAILEAIYSCWNIDKFVVADRGVRDGVIASLARKYGF